MAGIALRAAGAGLLCSSVLAVAFGSDVLPVPVHAGAGSGEGVSISMVPVRAAEDRAPEAVTQRQIAQFELPQAIPEIGAPPRPVVQRLTYQYAYGSESDATYRRNRDLDRRVPDGLLLLAPQINGIIVYRPTDWLETTLEMILEKEIPVNEKHSVVLPGGETDRARKRRASLPVDQAFVRLHNVTAPFDFSLGRKNYEDERHWLYDTSMDIASVSLRQGYWRVEAVGGREVRLDLDLAPQKRQVKDRVDTYILHADYRGIEDHRLAAYTIVRDDRTRNDGRAQLMGVRALGRPTDDFNYWVELAILRGTDAASQRFSGEGFDVGFTYRFTGVPLHPNVTLGYAFGSGDGNPNDAKNHEFRQSGLQSNEPRLASVSKFKYYGEVLDPELSNLKILTVGVGVRLAPNVHADLVYHRYRLDKIAEEIRGWALTAQMNQVDTHLSRDVGRAFDIVLGFRRLFGLPRLGLDVRAGWFRPGKAFVRNLGDAANPNIQGADRGISIFAKFWW